MTETVSILDGLVKEEDFCEAHGISKRTTARYRAQGWPYIIWNRQVHIDPLKWREKLRSKTIERNKPRRGARSQSV